jgi:uncharacterized protein (TIGR00304 family)
MSGRQRALLSTGIMMTAAGALLLALAVAVGQAELSLFLIIPVVHGSGALMALSILLIFGGLALTFMSMSLGSVGEPDDTLQEGARKEWGGVILLGPIPIVFGSGRSLRGKWPLLALAIISSLLLLVFVLTLLR